MQHVRSALFTAIFYPATVLFILIGLAAGLLAGPRYLRAVVHGWSDFHHLLVTRLLRIAVAVEGVVPPGPALIAVKHQSMMETIEILRIARTPMVVAKRELADMLLFGWIMRRYGVIPVDREAGARALREMLALGKAATAAGRPVVIFPEGTRVPVGEQPPLRAGFAGMYRMFGLPVIPIAVDSGRLWGRGMLKRPGRIRFRVGETIPAGLKREDIERQVHQAINALEGSTS